MTEFCSLCLEILLVVRICLNPNRHRAPLSPARILQDQPLFSDCWLGNLKLPHAEVEQNLRAQSVIAEIRWQSQLGIRFNSIQTVFL